MISRTLDIKTDHVPYIIGLEHPSAAVSAQPCQPATIDVSAGGEEAANLRRYLAER